MFISTSPRVIALVNSRLDRPHETEEHLPDAAAAGRWLAEHFGGAAGRTLSQEDFEAILRLRAAVRELIGNRIAGTGPGQAALAVLNGTAGRARKTERLTPAWSRETDYRPGEGTSRALVPLAILADEAIELLASDAGLAECGADDCVMVFIRTDPRRRWHDDRCGNRVRAARNYALRRQAAPRDT